MKRKAILFAMMAVLPLLAACQKTEAEKFDEKFTDHQEQLEAKAKAMEAEADKMMKEQTEQTGTGSAQPETPKS